MKKLIAIFLFFFSSISLADGYVCIADKSTGFKYDKNQRTWTTATFNVSDSKYTLTQSNGQWKWNKFGEQNIFPSNCGQFNEYGYLRCSPIMSSLSFNKKNLRYMLIYEVGYVSGGIVGTEGGDTPNMEIGKCSPM